MSRPFGLSKSKILSGLQCEKRLWLETHRPDLNEKSTSNELLFAQGNEVGEMARSIFGKGNGRLIGHVQNIGLALSETAEALQSEQLLFEPAFQTDGVVSRADALQKTKDGWNLIEVKGATSLKEYFLQDCAVQAWVLTEAGISLRSITLSHVDNRFLYKGNGDYTDLLSHVDITDGVRALQPEVPTWIARLRETLSRNEPEIETGRHCTFPYSCPFIGYCQSKASPAPEHPVSLLPRSAKLAQEMTKLGITDLREMPETAIKSDLHHRIWKAHVSGQPVLQPGAFASFNKLAWPRYFLDFETISFSVPRWIGTRPYQAVPFQWSCHIQAEDGSLRHAYFLDTTGASPIEGFAASLLETMGQQGPIFVYNQAFEASRIRELASMLPEMATTLLDLNNRMVDLLPITRDHYYHPDMQGSFSIKRVLPTVAPDLDYNTLGDVQDGGMAEHAWMQIADTSTPPAQKNLLRQALLEYCERDTLAMVRLAEVLSRPVHEQDGAKQSHALTQADF